MNVMSTENTVTEKQQNKKMGCSDLCPVEVSVSGTEDIKRKQKHNVRKGNNGV